MFSWGQWCKAGDMQRVKEFTKTERTEVETLLDTLWYNLNRQDNREPSSQRHLKGRQASSVSMSRCSEIIAIGVYCS